MRSVTGGLLGRAKRRVLDDLRADPYLLYILILATVMAGFWFWHRIPNFATRDERWRLIDPMIAVGFFAEDPGVESLLRGLIHGRKFGATFYLYGIALVPVFAVAFLTGQLDALAALPRYGDWYAQWNQTPRWIWTWSILLGRLANVALAVGCVYVVYRIGTEMGGRATGRLAAVLLSLTWGLLVLAHEVGEDVPALFFFLLVVYLGLRYAQTGDEALFLAASVSGGLAIAFKLTAVVCVLLIGLAYVLRVRNAGTEWREALVRPRLLAVGAALGAATIYVGFPSVIAGGLEPLAARVARGTSGKTEPHGWRVQPTWWWFLRSSLQGLGLPLFVAAVGALVASLPRLRRRSAEADGIAMAVVTVGGYLILYSNWGYVRTHHLLPTFPLLVVVLAALLIRVRDRSPAVARPLVAALVVSSALYAGVGVLGYATQPRDDASEWLGTHASANATVETYPLDPQEVAIPHGMRVYRPTNRHKTGGANEPITKWMNDIHERCPDYVVLNFRSVYALAPEDHYKGGWAKRLTQSRRTKHVENLLYDDGDAYRVAATFGPRPLFLRQDAWAAGLPELLRVGLFPRTIQHGDPQDFGVAQYTVILTRTGPCAPPGEESKSVSETTGASLGGADTAGDPSAETFKRVSAEREGYRSRHVRPPPPPPPVPA